MLASVLSHAAAFGAVSVAELVMVAIGVGGTVFAVWRSIFRPSDRRLRKGW